MANEIAAERFSLFREYYDELVRFLTVKLRSGDQALDVVQETFLHVLTQNSPTTVSKPRAFLYKTEHYAADFNDLAFFITEERRLMTHWKSVLPLSILTIQYEDVVANLEGEARRLIDFLGVPWDDRCLTFYQHDRAVQTPSRWQVRQPIYSRSVGGWQHDQAYLPDLSTVLADGEGA